MVILPKQKKESEREADLNNGFINKALEKRGRFENETTS